MRGVSAGAPDAHSIQRLGRELAPKSLHPHLSDLLFPLPSKQNLMTLSPRDSWASLCETYKPLYKTYSYKMLFTE